MSEMKGTVVKTIVTFLKGPWRVLTNRPTAAEDAALAKFRESRKPTHVGVKTSKNGPRRKNEYIMEVNTADWVYPRLEELSRRGISFRLGSIPIKQLVKEIEQGWISDVPTLVNDCTFAWANASYAFFLILDNAKDTVFALDELGLVATDSKKLSKRLQEITRIVQMRSCERTLKGNIVELDYKILTTEDMGLPEIYVDGMVAIRKSFAVRMCFAMPDGHEKRKKIAKINNGRMGRLIFRCTTPEGLIKGLAVICDDSQLEADVVCHASALKKELSTTSEFSWYATAFEHPHLHTAMWDMQSMFNNHTWLLTEQRFTQDVVSMLDEFKKEIESNRIPDWIIYQETESHDDSEAPAMDHAVTGWKKSYQRWQAAGMDIESSSNLLFMAFGSMKNQMSAARRNSRWWIPMSNAFMATVNTWEALKYLAGFDMPEEKRNLVFFDERFGVVIPGGRFAETADLHDTWDQDGDQAKFIRIKLWSSSPILSLDGLNHQELREQYVIPADLEVPCTPKDAIDVCVVIRSPNGPGGYSIERFDADTMPWLRACEERIPVIDLANAPAGMNTLLGNVEMGEIPTSVEYSKDGTFSKDRATSMISAQMNNPGVGAYANLIMAQSAIFGPSYPSVLPAIGNDIIDCVQQTSDALAFAYVKNGLAGMRQSMVMQIASTRTPVDRFVYETRLMNGLDDLQHELVEPFVVKGKFTTMDDLFGVALKDVEESTRSMSFTRRLSGQTRNFVMETIPVLPSSTQQWARSIWRKYDIRLQDADRAYAESVAESKSRVFTAFCEWERTQKIHKIVSDLYAEVAETAYPSKYAVALYRWIIDPKATGKPYGVSDRVIFQNGDDETQTVMDLLIAGIQELKNRN